MTKQKHMLRVLLCILLALALIPAYSMKMPEGTVCAAQKVKSVSLSKKKATVKAGHSITLKAKVFPAKAKNVKVTWKSSNTKVATVKNGKVTGISAGQATITAKAGGKKAVCKVNVTLSGNTAKALQAYREFLGAEKVSGWPQSDVKFILAYINADDIPELVIMHNESAAEIFYCDNGQVKTIGYAGYGLTGYYPRKGIVKLGWFHANYLGEGVESDLYVQIPKSGAVSQLGDSSRYFANGKTTNWQYTWNKKQVTKAKFTSLRKKSTGTKFVKFKGGFANTEKNRQKLKKLIRS